MNQPFRIGHGFDLHRLEEGLPLIVGGVRLPHDRGCAAHSDGDVVYHCVTDAICGALGEPDIGQLFPDTDPEWKGSDSRVFVEEAVRRMRAHGYAMGNLDVTVILQRPKLSPHKDAIRQNLSSLLGCDLTQVNIKGKTHEKVDSLGENRSIACHAVVLADEVVTMAKRDPKTASPLDPGFTGSELIVLLYGKEPFLQSEHTRRLREAIEEKSGREVESIRIDGERASLADVLDELRASG